MPFRSDRFFFSKLVGGRLLSHSVGIPNLIGIGGKLKKFSLQFFPKKRWAGWPGGLASHWQSPPACLPPWPGNIIRSPRNFFIPLPIWTKFGEHAHWKHGRVPTNFETNPRILNFSQAGTVGQGAREAVPTGKLPAGHPLPGWPKGKAESEKFFMSRPVWPNLSSPTLVSNGYCPAILKRTRQIFGALYRHV